MLLLHTRRRRRKRKRKIWPTKGRSKAWRKKKCGRSCWRKRGTSGHRGSEYLFKLCFKRNTFLNKL
jgi:hypothetical protein